MNPDKTGEKEKLPWGLKEVAPGSIKTLSQKELEAFELGILNPKKKHLSKREQEELRKKQEDEAAAQILDDFVASFENPTSSSMPKMFVKGATINPGSKEEKVGPDKGNIYTPALKLSNKTKQENRKDPSDLAAVAALSEVRKKGTEKRKSNLELFKEELKRMQMEREKSSKSKQADSSIEFQKIQKHDNDSSQDSLTNENESSQDSSTAANANKQNVVEDPNTTNIFISNLSQKTVEQDLVNRFGKYGLLASVKIMWPRSDEEKFRSANCGFVAFMCRRDAEQALRELDGTQENGQTMRLSWSKAINIPSKPFYIPPDFEESFVPPPHSGLPLNAQPQDKYRIRDLKRKIRRLKRKHRRYRSTSSSRSSSSSSDSSQRERRDSDPKKNLNRNLEKCLVKVVVPTDRNQLNLIHHMVEFVIKHGPTFEAVIMSRELNNPQFRFLYDNQCLGHIYYRWKLYSILNGDSVSKWNTDPFKMVKDGSYWRPPQLGRYTQGPTDETYVKIRRELEAKKSKLSPRQKEEIENIFKNLTTERKSISEAMIYFVENSDKADEIVDLFEKSFTNYEYPLNKTIARIFVMSDVLHNCLAKVSNVHYYRKGFENILSNVFDNLHKMYKNIDGKMKSESFKQKILSCIRAWEDWAIYSNDFLVNLQNQFLGLSSQISEKTSEPKVDEDVDGKPLDESESESIDGKPLDEGPDIKNKFVASKWETVDPEKLEKQAITTSKWDFFDESQTDVKTQTQALAGLNVYGSGDEEGKNSDDEDIDGKPMDEEDEIDEPKLDCFDEERRKKLREIELEVLKYIDDVESGKIAKDPNQTIQAQAESYRAKLIKLVDDDLNLKKNADSKNEEKINDKIRHRSSSSSSSSSSSAKRRSSHKSNKKKQRRSSSKSPNRRASHPSYASPSINKKRY